MNPANAGVFFRKIIVARLRFPRVLRMGMEKGTKSNVDVKDVRGASVDLGDLSVVGVAKGTGPPPKATCTYSFCSLCFTCLRFATTDRHLQRRKELDLCSSLDQGML